MSRLNTMPREQRELIDAAVKGINQYLQTTRGAALFGAHTTTTVTLNGEIEVAYRENGERVIVTFPAPTSI